MAVYSSAHTISDVQKALDNTESKVVTKITGEGV